MICHSLISFSCCHIPKIVYKIYLSYLEDAMQFIIPFVKSGKKQQGNISISSELEKNSKIDVPEESNDEIIQSDQKVESS